jgi:hypothetical protein
MSASAPASSSAAPSRGGVSGFDGSGDARSFELKLVHLQNLHDRQIQSLESAVQRLIDDNRSLRGPIPLPVRPFLVSWVSALTIASAYGVRVCSCLQMRWLWPMPNWRRPPPNPMRQLRWPPLLRQRRVRRSPPPPVRTVARAMRLLNRNRRLPRPQPTPKRRWRLHSRRRRSAWRLLRRQSGRAPPH